MFVHKFHSRTSPTMNECYACLDYATPQRIRESISGRVYAAVSGNDVESSLNSAKSLVEGVHACACTNWVKFAPKRGLSLGSSDFKQLVHLPVKDDFLCKLIPHVVHIFTVFSPWDNTIAVHVCGTAEMVKRFEQHPMVQKVMQLPQSD